MPSQMGMNVTIYVTFCRMQPHCYAFGATVRSYRRGIPISDMTVGISGLLETLRRASRQNIRLIPHGLLATGPERGASSRWRRNLDLVDDVNDQRLIPIAAIDGDGIGDA